MKKRITLRPEFRKDPELVKAIETDLNVKIRTLRSRGYSFRQASAAVEQMIQRDMENYEAENRETTADQI